MNKEDRYPQDLDMTKFKHIPEISVYNHNYYVGFGNDLLYAESDDDNETEWFWVYMNDFIKIGYSYTSEGDKLVHI